MSDRVRTAAQKLLDALDHEREFDPESQYAVRDAKSELRAALAESAPAAPPPPKCPARKHLPEMADCICFGSAAPQIKHTKDCSLDLDHSGPCEHIPNDGTRPSPPLSDAEAQRRSFAFGNANLADPKVTREMVGEEAEKMEAQPVPAATLTREQCEEMAREIANTVELNYVPRDTPWKRRDLEGVIADFLQQKLGGGG